MSKKRDQVFDQMVKVGNDAKHAKNVVDALTVAARETLALMGVTRAEECHADITALVWESVRDLRRDQPIVAVMLLANVLSAAAITLATVDR